jgi:hypothetical protein
MWRRPKLHRVLRDAGNTVFGIRHHDAVPVERRGFRQVVDERDLDAIALVGAQLWARDGAHHRKIGGAGPRVARRIVEFGLASQSLN